MIVDAVDRLGRRYMEAIASGWVEPCVECDEAIVEGQSFFMRNEADDGTQDGLFGALAALTYDAVCFQCGERQLKRDAG